MLISVIIPTYKPGNYIIECLKSLANQTLSPNCFEIIIVLNGCREPYEEFVKNGSYNACKEKGVTRLEGKDYVVQDGDLVHFRFSV